MKSSPFKSKPVIGLPRALGYHWFGKLWSRFFKELQFNLIISPPTSRSLMELGFRAGLPELCLPVKVFLSHVAWLSSRSDFVFVPRLTSLEQSHYMCPIFLGLPDMAAALLDRRPIILSEDVNMKQQRDHARALVQTGMQLGATRLHAECAFRAACALSANVPRSGHETVRPRDASSGPQILVVGHPYVVFDQQVSLNLIQRIELLGAKVIFSGDIPLVQREESLAKLTRPVYWTSANEVIGAALAGLCSSMIDGVIFVACFGCGPDSLLLPLVDQFAFQLRRPFLPVVVDEHTSAVGVQSRIEAFIDMTTNFRHGGCSKCGSA